MDIGIELSNGKYVIASQSVPNTPQTAGSATAIDLQILGSNLSSQPVQRGGYLPNEWIGLAPTSTGGFTLYWQDPSTGVLDAQDYTSQIQQVGSIYTVSSPPPPAQQAFSSSQALAETFLNDRGTASIGHGPNTPLYISKVTASGATSPSYVVNSTASGETFGTAMVAPTAETGGYVAAWVDLFSNGGYQVEFAQFSGSGQLEGRGVVSSGQANQFTGLELMGLPDGNFAIGLNFSWGPVIYDELNAQGQELNVWEDNGLLYGMAALPDGRWAATYTRSGQVYTQVFTEKGQNVDPSDPAPQNAPQGHESLVSGSLVKLSASTNDGRADAAVLSNGSVAVVDTHYSNGWYQGSEQTYNSSGAEIASTALYEGGTTLSPLITAFPVGGFYEVTYGGSSDYEIYNANNQRVFVHNQYTSPTGAFAPLSNGGYVTTDSSSNVFGLFDANNHNVGWISIPSDAPGTPTVNALNGGGFAFTYAGTSHYDLYGVSGNLLADGNLGASSSQFATGFAALAGNGFLEAWLSPDGSTYNGVATSLDVQAVGPAGAITPAITLTQDLDPWHTQFKLQAHADGSAAIFWSQGGAVFGAEYANGAVGPAFAAGVLGNDLAHTVAVELPGDKEGFAWVSGDGHAWAEIFDPATGQAVSADLGVSSGPGISAVATAQGGIAVSWHHYADQGAVLDASGQVGALSALGGLFAGVNAAGQAVVFDAYGAVQGSMSTPTIHTYTLNDGAFWVH